MKILWGLLGVGLIVFYRKKLIEDYRFLRETPRDWLRDKWENWIKPLIVAGILAIGIRTFLLGPYKIPTGSMRLVLMEGDRIFVDKISYRFKEPERGDIIVFRYPLDRKKDFVKRLVGLPGESLEIRDGQVYVNGEKLDQPAVFTRQFYYNREDWQYGKKGEEVQVPAGNFFVLGDNSAQSSDSRNWGFVPRRDVIGKAVLIWWPFQRFHLLKNSHA